MNKHGPIGKFKQLNNKVKSQFIQHLKNSLTRKLENEILGIESPENKFKKDNKLIDLMKKQITRKGGKIWNLFSVQAYLKATDNNFVSTFKDAAKQVQNFQNTNSTMSTVGQVATSTGKHS